MSELKNSEIKILLIDDILDVLEGYKEYLEELYDYKIDTAISAKDGLEKLKNESFAVVITDMRMEKNDSGFDILDAINKEQLTTFVIILTANSTVEGCRKAWKNQAWDYISKSTESVETNHLDEVHDSIQEVMSHLDKWDGHLEDKNWVEKERTRLSKEYANKFISVLHREVVASADNRDDLVEELLKKKIPPHLAYTESFILALSDEKATVFVEGPTDIKYIEKALELFSRNDLLDKLKIDTVGDKTGQINSGEQNMKNAFAFLKETPERSNAKGILFLFDNDITDKNLPNKGKDYKNICIERMGVYQKSNFGVSGIESFFEIDLYEEGLKQGWIRKNIRHCYKTGECEETTEYKVLKKVEFTNWLIENRGNKDVFSKFDGIIAILDKFLDRIK